MGSPLRIIMPSDPQQPSDPVPSPPLEPPMNEALDWFARLRGANVTAEEQRAFVIWHAADPKHEESYRKLVAMWGSEEFTAAVRLQRQERPALHSPKTSRRTRTYAAAACLLLAIGAMNVTALRIAFEADYRTATGERERVSLTDGSAAILNSGSAMVVGFTTTERRLTLLKGEAYVEVTKDPQRAFELIGGQAVARVLGTAFSLQIDEGQTVVTVRRGEVAVRQAGHRGPEVRLHAGEQVRVASGAVSDPRRLDVDAALAWTDGRIRFHDRPLGDVLSELDRYHAGLILVMNPQLNAVKVNGNYRLDDPVAIVASLAEVTKAKLTRISDYLLILR